MVTKWLGAVSGHRRGKDSNADMNPKHSGFTKSNSKKEGTKNPLDQERETTATVRRSVASIKAMKQKVKRSAEIRLEHHGQLLSPIAAKRYEAARSQGTPKSVPNGINHTPRTTPHVAFLHDSSQIKFCSDCGRLKVDMDKMKKDMEADTKQREENYNKTLATLGQMIEDAKKQATEEITRMHEENQELKNTLMKSEEAIEEIEKENDSLKKKLDNNRKKYEQEMVSALSRIPVASVAKSK